MSPKKVFVRLKGGLGNQMFQYAAGRALALRNNMALVLDTMSGFSRDRVYQRTFSLGSFQCERAYASRFEQLPFWYEQVRSKLIPGTSQVIEERPWGLFVRETHQRYLESITTQNSNRNMFMEGYWQSERYFADYVEFLSREFAPPAPKDDLYLSMARKIEGCNAVAVGVRVFEERPDKGKYVLGSLVPYSFYEYAAIQLSRKVNAPSFFVFSTEDRVRGKFSLPGHVEYLTPSNGYDGEIETLWLISRCAHHILSNSTFYWWAAWLAERVHTDSLIIASSQFTNSDCIPPRWLSIQTGISL